MKPKVIRVLNAIIRRGYWYNNDLFKDCNKFQKYNTFNTEIVNIGSTSSVYAFNYDKLNIKGANWALNSNPLTGDFAVLRNYSGYLKDNKSVVLIPLCPFSLLAGSYDYLDDRYYSILYPTTIPNYSYIHDVQVRNKIANPISIYPIIALFSDLKHLIFKEKDKIITDERMQLDAANKIKSWCFEFSITSFSKPLSIKNKDSVIDAVKIIHDIISFCRKHGYMPVVVIPPVYKSLSNYFTPEVINLLLGSAIDLLNRESIQVCNHLYEENISNNITLFKDSFLLNKKGAELYTRKLLREINTPN